MRRKYTFINFLLDRSSKVPQIIFFKTCKILNGHSQSLGFGQVSYWLDLFVLSHTHHQLHIWLLKTKVGI
jgi:hypothetical protein